MSTTVAVANRERTNGSLRQEKSVTAISNVKAIVKAALRLFVIGDLHRGKQDRTMYYERLYTELRTMGLPEHISIGEVREYLEAIAKELEPLRFVRR